MHRLIIFISLLALIAGCTATQTNGVKLDPNAVARIQKGVTTRAEVESLLGQPMTMAMADRGRRIMVYHFTESAGRSKPQSYIPVVGLFAGATEGTSRTQMLQIFLDGRNVVEDYEFSDRTTVSEGSGLMGIMNVKSRTEATREP